MVRFLGGFQDQVARLFTGRILRRQTDIKWEYTLVATERKEAVFDMMEAYIWRR